jgi:fructokinase
LDSRGQAAFVIEQPAAWDFICIRPGLLAALKKASAFVYGSLAARSSISYGTLQRLLAIHGPLKIFDVNLRPPFSPRARVLALARAADVIKLNEVELATLSGEKRKGIRGWLAALERLRHETSVARWCVTLGPKGALWWDGGQLLSVCAPIVKVRDTVGAGDAFLAALTDDLTHALAKRAVWPRPKQMEKILARACRLGALVASRDGACPEYRMDEIV